VEQIDNNPLLCGLTLTGGEPFEQGEALAPLAQAARRRGLTVWAYSGYLFEELLGNPLLRHCDVLVDGPFERDKRDPDLPWRGSANQRLINVQEELLARAAAGVIAIDGRCGAGKSSLAARLSRRLRAPVVRADDFFPLRGQAAGPVNLDVDRFLEEAAPHLLSGAAFAYRPYNGREGAFGAPVDIPARGVRIVEGAYCHCPELRGLANITVFVDIDKTLQQKRLLAREGPGGLKAFNERWIAMEERYFELFDIKNRADFVINSGSISAGDE
jgi:uridine kinase